MRRLRQSVCCFVLILSVWSMAGCSPGRQEETETFSVTEEEQESQAGAAAVSGDSEKEPSSIWVYVCGEVRAPGVYELETDSRVYEAIEAAGGMTETAAFSYLNQAELLSDGQKIYVPAEEEVRQGDCEVSVEQSTDDGRIDINTATKEELMTLSGIGEVRAEAIIHYREKQGGFSSIEELKEVEGIKDGVFEKVKDLIKVS